MISNLAKGFIQELEKEGLKPSFEDIIKLNNYGLKAEKISDELFDFSSEQRVCFLNDTILREPVIAVRLWIEKVSKYFEDSESKVYFLAWVLSQEPSELPSANNWMKILSKVKKFKDAVLLKCTETQILKAIDYILNGNYPEEAEDDDEEEEKENDELFETNESKSVIKQLLLQAVSEGVSPDVANFALPKDLERLVVQRMINKGIDIVKDRRSDALGKFYIFSGKLREKLRKEKDLKNG